MSSLKSDVRMMSVRRHMWDHDSINTGEGKDSFLEKGIMEKSDK